MASSPRMVDRWNRCPEDGLPDVRDGLTRLERVVLVELSRAQAANGGRNVPTAMLYGRVVEHINVSVSEFQRVLVRLGAARAPTGALRPGKRS